MGGVCWDSRRDFLCGGGGGGVATERGYSSNVESSRGVVLPVGTTYENRKLQYTLVYFSKLQVHSSILLQTLVYLSTLLHTQYTPVNYCTLSVLQYISVYYCIHQHNSVYFSKLLHTSVYSLAHLVMMGCDSQSWRVIVCSFPWVEVTLWWVWLHRNEWVESLEGRLRQEEGTQPS